MEIEPDELLNDEELESDYSDGEEKALEQEVISLEKQIAENKFAYQPYVDLINTLKSLVDLDRLRNARDRMSKQFPLSPDLWMDWLQDEINVATSPEEKKKVLELFETAVKDYLAVDIWLQYVTFVICNQNEQNSSETGNVRRIFEESLIAAGLHVTKGSILWDTYIEYEKTVLSTLMEKQEEYEAQLKLIGNLYKRQLSCPLWGMESTYEKFKNWVTENEKDNSEKIIDLKMVDSIFKKAKEKFDKIKPYEEALLAGVDNQMETYKSYLEHEKSKEGSPVRVQCLYERIICENCLNEEIWLEYIDYVDTVLNNKDIVLGICKRALRNCPWCCKIYQVYIRCLEKYGEPQKKITEAVEEAFGSGLQTASDFRDIWMSYLVYLRRSFDSPNISEEEEEKRLEELKAAFGKAVEFLYELPDADPDCTVAQFWARIEANYCKNMEKSRELWNSILSEEKNKTAEMWLEYIHLERTFGDSKHLRKLFPRALQYTTDWPETIAKVWLNYERDEGSLDSYENCINKIKVRLKQIQEKRLREAEAFTIEKPTNNFSKKSKKIAFVKQKEKNNFNSENEGKKIIGYKRKQTDSIEEGSPTKKTKQDNETEMKEEGDEGKKLSNDDLVKILIEESKNSHGETVVHDPSKDDRTVFVSNLDFATEEAEIRNTFSSCGVITDLRLVRDYKGRSKGYCYVEFEKPVGLVLGFRIHLRLLHHTVRNVRSYHIDSMADMLKEAQMALKKDRELINRRPMFVSKCDPDKETRGSGFKYSLKLEKNKLFVRGLSFATTEQDLRELYSQYGALRDVRLVTYRNGHSKGLAYVEFEDEASAAQAVLKTDRTQLQGKEISVAISNPPERKPEGTSKITISLGGGPKELGPRGKGRTQISFLPRSLQLTKPNSPDDSLANLSIKSPAPAEQKKLNNSDFRRLLG